MNETKGALKRMAPPPDLPRSLRAQACASVGRRIAFWRIAAIASANARMIVPEWLPGGKKAGREWVVPNPRRLDLTPGCFKVNLASGRWGDFATGDSGSDLISLAAYLYSLGPVEAVHRVAGMLGIDPYEM